MKRITLLAFAVALVAAFAIPAGSAMAWTPPGGQTLDTTASGGSPLVSTIKVGGVPVGSVTSDATFGATLGWGVLNGGVVTSAGFSSTTSTLPGTTTVTANTLPWGLTGVNQGGGDGSVSIDANFHVASSAGPTLNVAGTVTGDYSSGAGTLTFDSSGASANYASTLTVTSSFPGGPPVGSHVDLDGAVGGGTAALQ
jgi:hypothetical protein